VITDIVKIVVLLKDISYMGYPDHEYSSLRQSNPHHATKCAFATCVVKITQPNQPAKALNPMKFMRNKQIRDMKVVLIHKFV
jgi:hypothetical protein